MTANRFIYFSVPRLHPSNLCYNEYMTHSKTQIIAFVGMPGSGKSTAVDYLTEKGYPKVYFGGVVLAAVKEAGLDITPENEMTIRNKLRAEEGDDFIAKRIAGQINDLIAAGQHRIIADGLYSWTEYKTLKHAFPGELSLIAVLAPRHIRHHRLANRPERPLNAEEAKQRDWNEIEMLNKGGPIAMAEYFVINDHDIEAYDANLEKILKELDF